MKKISKFIINHFGTIVATIWFFSLFTMVGGIIYSIFATTIMMSLLLYLTSSK